VAYVSGYQHDIFVSYAHGPTPSKFADRSKTARLRQWTQHLVEDLKEELSISLRTKDPDKPDIYIDTEFQGNQGLTETFEEHVQRSAILLVVMSDFFLDSTYCADEVEAFQQANARRGGKENIFVVRAFPTDEERWPEALRDSGGRVLVGYSFHPRGTFRDVDIRPFAWPVPKPIEPDYSTAVTQLAGHLGRRLKQFPPEEPVRAGARPDGTGPGVPNPRGTVFLGWMHDTLDEVREQLRARIEKAGIAVVAPEIDSGEAELRAFCEKYLIQSDALVLVANEHRSSFGPLSLQIEQAKRYKKPYFMWLTIDDLQPVKKLEYREFLQGLLRERLLAGNSLRYPDIDGFAAGVIAGLSGSPPPSPPDPKDAVVCTNRPGDGALGEDFQEIISATLFELNQSPIIFDFDDPDGKQIKNTDLERRIQDAVTLLVLCFDQDWDWAKRLLKLLNGLRHTRDAAKTRLLVAGPRDRSAGRWDARAWGFQTVDGVDKDSRAFKELLTRALVAAAERGRPGDAQTVVTP
jgi:hypothetical protein